jgi:formate hydrogenlyase subunit 6/NADH:ubiquinone oxidoreductase subunit I
MFKMTPTIVRNFLNKRATRRYPYVVRAPFENVRGALHNEISTCTFCGACAAKCPSQCIVVDRKNATWQCDPFACVYCGICVESCKFDSLKQEPPYRPAAAQREMIFLKGELKKKEKATESSPPSSDSDG